MFREVIIGLINVFMGVDFFQILPDDRSVVLSLGKAILTTASALLVLGTLFAQKQHRAHIHLIWLSATGIYILTQSYEIRQKLFYYNCSILGIYTILLVCMDAVIYKVYTKELKKSKDSIVCEKPPTPTAPVESVPPSYEAMVPQVHVC